MNYRRVERFTLRKNAPIPSTESADFENYLFSESEQYPFKLHPMVQHQQERFRLIRYCIPMNHICRLESYKTDRPPLRRSLRKGASPEFPEAINCSNSIRIHLNQMQL
ncbi:hypothetical protein CDAR_579541 [Caerostris darwini]|uniref:Uncharacterized protein n=1 Tax=Caerostris darwini TaxID=1538125 RepID=A0AAV4V339_9ARAC|nr:hypothetical protein CDAR_579541 [Caerostris darwini]